jgi:hypothetical protein
MLSVGPRVYGHSADRTQSIPDHVDRHRLHDQQSMDSSSCVRRLKLKCCAAADSMLEICRLGGVGELVEDDPREHPEPRN